MRSPTDNAHAILGVFFCIFALSCAHKSAKKPIPQTLEDEASVSQSSEGFGWQKPVTDDQQIDIALADIVSLASRAGGHSLEMRVNDGAVIISGHAADEVMAGSIVRLTKSISGVQSVRNELVVTTNGRAQDDRDQSIWLIIFEIFKVPLVLVFAGAVILLLLYGEYRLAKMILKERNNTNRTPENSRSSPSLVR